MTHLEEGLDFTLSHFQEPIWPRAISTKTTECRQVLVNNRDVALARFKQSNYQDCRISAYSPNADENQSAVARFAYLCSKFNPQKYQRKVGCGHTYSSMVWPRLSYNTTVRCKWHNT